MIMFPDKQDEVVYYDPCENLEELRVLDRVTGLQDDVHPEVRELSRQRQQLESRRGWICTRRARLRNRTVGAQGSSPSPRFQGGGSLLSRKVKEASKIRLWPTHDDCFVFLYGYN